MEKFPTQKFQTIWVFGGSTLGKDPEYVRAASSLGNLLATRKIKLVYGEKSGLMECVVKSALSCNGKVLGILPNALTDMNPRCPTLGEEFKVPSMREQLATMLHNADAFIALPGGLKTLEEIFCISSWAQLGMHQKPVGLLSVNGFYDGLCHFINHCFSEGFISFMTPRTITAARTAEELIDRMHTCVSELEPILSKIERQESGGSSKKKHEIDTTLKL